MARVLVLGRTGMLGHMLMRVLAKEPSCEVDGTQRVDPTEPLWLDALQGAQALRTLVERQGRYDYMINAIGLLGTDIDERDDANVRQAIAVNAWFPHEVAAVARATGARVIHFSTDGVFSGAAGPYTEDALQDCPDVYGKTKSLGEIREPGVVVLRCSVIGPDPMGRRGLLEWLLSQPEGATVPGYTDVWWNGVTTLQAARVCRALIAEDRFADVSQESTVHHICPNRPVSKHELLQQMAAAFEKRVTIQPTRRGLHPIRRVLATRYQRLAALTGRDQEVAQALRALAHVAATEVAVR